MRYQEPLFRPPSEARSYILQATIGCSWNKCSYCVMYRGKEFRVRDLQESIEDLESMGRLAGTRFEKIFVADGDALILPMDHWRAILRQASASFPRLRQVSCYAMASNVLEKSQDELSELRELGLSVLYLGPESGSDKVLKRIVKGSTAAEHVEAAHKAHAAGMKISVIAMLGVAGKALSEEHAAATAQLVTDMDPEYFAALTTGVVPGTPLARMQEKGMYEMPDMHGMLRELRTIVDEARPRRAVFRTNHASNYLPLAGSLPDDREAIVAAIDGALAGRIPVRPDWMRQHG